MKIPGILFARGGSVRLPRKCVKDFCGKPLLVWMLLAMKHCKYVDDIFMCTDDDEIAEIAKHYGAEIIWQPTCQCNYGEFGGRIADVWIAQNLEEMGYEYDIHTSGLITNVFAASQDFDNMIEIMHKHGPDEVVSVVKLATVISKLPPPHYNLQYMHWVGDWKTGEYCFKAAAGGVISKKSLKKYSWPTLLKNGKMKSDVAAGTADLTSPEYRMCHQDVPLQYPYFVPEWKFCEIDTQDQWDVAECKFTKFKDRVTGGRYGD